MNKTNLLAVFLTAALAGGTAQAADLTAQPPAPAAPAAAAPVSPFDFAFGGKLQSDYISRGITQTNHEPDATAYGELRYNFDTTQIYAGTQIWSTKLPTDPAGEVDLYGGVRETLGNFGIDVGGIEYWYPDNTSQYWTNGVTTVLNPPGADAATCAIAGYCATTAHDPSYFELYAKPTYNVTDSLTIGGNLYFSPNWNDYDLNETYLSGTAKYAFGTTGFSVSGELGHEWLGHTKTSGSIFAPPGAPFSFVGYTTWNAGVSYNWKALTLDLRYYGTDLGKAACYADTSDPAGNPGAGHPGVSNWCGQRIMASLSFDLTADALK